MKRHAIVRVVVGTLAAFLLSVTLVYAGDYNTNPLYCRNHSAFDPLWWIYQCWLPDPPGDPQA